MELSRSEFELESIVRRIDDGELDLQPDFQRGEIWDNKRRQRLIDSLLREWYVPAIHIVRGTDDSLEIVLDGQQRLAAIRDFFNNQFPVDGTIVPANELIQSLHGLRFSELPPAIRRRLKRFALPCVTLKNFDPEEPNELFFRLNQAYNLTPPEKRNALHGPARHQVKDLVNELKEVGLLRSDVIGFSNGRLAYDDIVARTCLAIERGTIRQHINNNVVERFYRDSAFSDETVRGVSQAGEELFQLAMEVRTKLRFNKATLFSWLYFCYWAPIAIGSQLPPFLLDKFEGHRLELKRSKNYPSDLPEDLVGAVLLYDDRASYRVTDVSSVLARDCVLYIYLQRVFSAPAVGSTSLLLQELHHASESAAQQQILSFVLAETSNWGVMAGGEYFR